MRALLSLWMFLAPHAAAAPRGEDLACLAAVPAMTVATDGTPAVIALGEAGEVPPEVADYLRRYRPTASYVLGSPVSGPHRRLLADSADAAAIVLARTFWKASARAVVCRDDDYGAALLASALAGRLRAPLIFTGAKGLSAGTWMPARLTSGLRLSLPTPRRLPNCRPE